MKKMAQNGLVSEIQWYTPIGISFLFSFLKYDPDPYQTPTQILIKKKGKI